jgi:transposase
LYLRTSASLLKLLKQRRETGSLAPLPRGGWATAKLNEEHLLTLAELAARQPDATLEELRRQLRRVTKVEVSISTIWRGLERIEFTQKKDQARARG